MNNNLPFARLPWKCSKPDAELTVRITDKHGHEILVCEATIGALIVDTMNNAQGLAEDHAHLHEGMHILADMLLFATRNRFGKCEWFTTEGRAACEAIRTLAVSHKCTPSHTQLEQAGKVARAIATACGGEQ